MPNLSAITARLKNDENLNLQSAVQHICENWTRKPALYNGTTTKNKESTKLKATFGKIAVY